MKQKDPSSCTLYERVGANDLSLNDVVVEDKESNIICIRARFSLAIKVQEPLEPLNEANGVEKATNETSDAKPVLDLGYLQLDQIKSIENTCPELAKDGDEAQYPDELKMIVTFECGKLTFNFKKEESYYLSSIKGSVILGNSKYEYVKRVLQLPEKKLTSTGPTDSSIEAEFLSEQPMFFTSDLTHHFRFNDLIEVSSSVKTEKLKLTANFYNTEIEAFRKTNSRSFVRQADEKSRPFFPPVAAAAA